MSYFQPIVIIFLIFHPILGWAVNCQVQQNQCNMNCLTKNHPTCATRCLNEALRCLQKNNSNDNDFTMSNEKNKTCRVNKIGTEFTRVVPMPHAHRGSWVIACRTHEGIRFIYENFSDQSIIAKENRAFCTGSVGGTVAFELGGCDYPHGQNNGVTAMALPKNMSIVNAVRAKQVWLGCDVWHTHYEDSISAENRAREKAERKCELKSGCPCISAGPGSFVTISEESTPEGYEGYGFSDIYP